MSLGLAIPLFDEEALVEDVVNKLQRVLDSADIDYHLALVDNGSSDGTGPAIRRLAEHPRLTAVHLSPNAGYGGGILAGLEALGLYRDTGPVVLGWYWGDGQVAPRILPILYRHCMDGAALAKAERTQRYDGTTRRITGWGYAAWLRMLGVRTRDVNGCPKLLRKEILSQVAPRDTGWALDTEVVISVERLAGEIIQEPTTMDSRPAGSSKVHWGTAWQLARAAVRHRSGQSS